MPEPIDVERTEVIERREDLDDDEPAPLPPPPGRGSSTYQALSEPLSSERAFTRVSMPRKRIGSCGPEVGTLRRSQQDTLVDDEGLYQALLRQLRS